MLISILHLSLITFHLYLLPYTLLTSPLTLFSSLPLSSLFLVLKLSLFQPSQNSPSLSFILPPILNCLPLVLTSTNRLPLILIFSLFHRIIYFPSHTFNLTSTLLRSLSSYPPFYSLILVLTFNLLLNKPFLSSPYPPTNFLSLSNEPQLFFGFFHPTPTLLFLFLTSTLVLTSLSRLTLLFFTLTATLLLSISSTVMSLFLFFYPNLLSIFHSPLYISFFNHSQSILSTFSMSL